MSGAVWVAPVEGLADKLKALIGAGKVPASISIARVEAAVGKYAAFMPTDKALPPSKAARKAEKLMKQADILAVELASLPFEITGALAVAGARPEGAYLSMIVADTRAMLAQLAGALELARREIADAPYREGRPPSPRARLVLDLASIVEETGEPADAQQAGPLVKLTETILKAHGENFTEAKQIVETALQYRKLEG